MVDEAETNQQQSSETDNKKHVLVLLFFVLQILFLLLVKVILVLVVDRCRQLLPPAEVHRGTHVHVCFGIAGGIVLVAQFIVVGEKMFCSIIHIECILCIIENLLAIDGSRIILAQCLIVKHIGHTNTIVTIF